MAFFRLSHFFFVSFDFCVFIFLFFFSIVTILVLMPDKINQQKKNEQRKLKIVLFACAMDDIDDGDGDDSDDVNEWNRKYVAFLNFVCELDETERNENNETERQTKKKTKRNSEICSVTNHFARWDHVVGLCVSFSVSSLFYPVVDPLFYSFSFEFVDSFRFFFLFFLWESVCCL